MLRRILAAILVTSAWVSSAAVQADIYSPTQAEFLGLQYVDFINNEEPDNAGVDSIVALGTDAAIITFDTDLDIDDNLWRVAMENTDISHDLTGLDAFSIMFSNPVAPDGVNITAQMFVRSANDSVFTSSGALQLGAAFPVTLSVPVSQIIAQGGDPSDISSFGIEFFGGDEFLGSQDLMATVQTAPQPPDLEDHVLYSWEGSLEGWVPGFQPDHAHALSSTGATLGTSALQIARTVTGQSFPPGGENTTFRWGSQVNIDANAGGGAPEGDYNNNGTVDAADYVLWRKHNGTATVLPNDTTPGVSAADYTVWRGNFGDTGGGTDPEILEQIAEIVDLINDPDAYSISFDLTIQDQFPGANPGWANFFLSVAADDGNPDDGNDAFFQAPQIDVDVSTLSTGPVTVTLDFLLSQFDDAAENGTQLLAEVGLNPDTQYLTFNLASNFPTATEPVTFTFYIDNFRIRHIIPEGNRAALVPEPGSLALLAAALVFAAFIRCRGVYC